MLHLTFKCIFSGNYSFLKGELKLLIFFILNTICKHFSLIVLPISEFSLGTIFDLEFLLGDMKL